MRFVIDVDLPADLEKCRLPFAVQCRLDRLLDRQDAFRAICSLVHVTTIKFLQLN